MLLRKNGKVDMGTEPVGSTLYRLAMPSMISMIFHTLFHLCDTVFISWLGGTQMAAMALVYPVFFMVFALTNGMSVGTTTLMARLMGQHEGEKAKRCCNASLILLLLLSLIPMPLLHRGLSDFFFSALGGTGDVLSEVYRYTFWLVLSFPLMSYSLLADSTFRSQGDAVTPMYSLVLGNGLNLILDPLFIFTLGWGITGASFASFLGRAASSIYLASRLRHRSQIHPHLIWERDYFALWRKISSIGLPVAISMGSRAIGVAVVNRALSQFGQGAIAAWMLGNRIEGIAFLPLFGLNAALVPFVSYNLGRKEHGRLLSAMRISALAASLIMVTIGIVLYALPHVFLALFRPSAEIEAMATASIRASITGYLFAAIDITFWGLFQGSGRSIYGMISQVVQSIVIRIPLVYWLAARYGIDGIWWFQPISMFVAFSISSVFVIRLLRQLDIMPFPRGH